MIVSVLLDGELRLYEEADDVVSEWGRLRIRSDALTHETAVRLIMDLASLAGANGTGALVVEEDGQRALPPPRGRGFSFDDTLREAVAKLYPDGMEERVATALVAAGGRATIHALATAVKRPTKNVSTALYTLKTKGIVHRVSSGLWALGPTDTKPRQQRGPTVRHWTSEVYAALEAAGGSMTRTELYDALAKDNHDRSHVRDVLQRGTYNGRLVQDGERYWNAKQYEAALPEETTTAVVEDAVPDEPMT